MAQRTQPNYLMFLSDRLSAATPSVLSMTRLPLTDGSNCRTGRIVLDDRASIQTSVWCLPWPLPGSDKGIYTRGSRIAPVMSEALWPARGMMGPPDWGGLTCRLAAIVSSLADLANPDASRHWLCRICAEEVGMGGATVARSGPTTTWQHRRFRRMGLTCRGSAVHPR